MHNEYLFLFQKSIIAYLRSAIKNIFDGFRRNLFLRFKKCLVRFYIYFLFAKIPLLNIVSQPTSFTYIMICLGLNGFKKTFYML